MVWLLCKKKFHLWFLLLNVSFMSKGQEHGTFSRSCLLISFWTGLADQRLKNAWSTTEASLFTGRTSWLFFSPGKMEVITDWEWGCSYHFIVHFISWCFLFYWQLYIIFNGMICIHVHSWWLGDKKASPISLILSCIWWIHRWQLGLNFRTVGFCLWHINAWSQIQRIQN